MHISPSQIKRFDELLVQVLEELPDELLKCFDEIPLVVEDRPSRQMAMELGLERGDLLQGVHSGIPLTRRSVEHSGTLPTVITIYREGILGVVGMRGRPSDEALRREIRVTVLHELGHHFGMSEEDLRQYGYE